MNSFYLELLAGEYYYFNTRSGVGEQQTAVQVARSKAKSATVADNHTNSAKKDECIRLRGTSGYWFRDEKLAQQTFYAQGFRSKKLARQNDIRTGVYNGFLQLERYIVIGATQ